MHYHDPKAFEKADLLSQAMERVGFAIWQVQAAEEAAATFVVIRLKGSKGMGRTKGHSLLRGVQKRTFGALVAELQKADVLEERLVTRLRKATEERNWLVHRGRRESSGMLSKPDVYRTLMQRVDALAEQALQLQKELGDQIKQFVVASGVSEEQLNEEVAHVTKDWDVC